MLVFVAISTRAFHLQVLGKDEWSRRADRQRQNRIPLVPQRGTIFDRNGEPLAQSLEVDSLYAEPRKVKDPAAVAASLSAVIGLSVSELQGKLSSGKGFLWIKRQLSPDESRALKGLKVQGVGLTKEHMRFYANSELGAQVIGFTGLDPNGLEGIELKYDSVLLGQSGYFMVERDALGRGMGSGDLVVEGGDQGSNLYLTLDKSIQYITEKALAEGLAKSKARAGTVVVLEPKTGKVLAMASKPDFNPNAVGRYKPSQLRNRAICDTYEPGSTVKTFLMAAALSEKIVKPNDNIKCEKGSFVFGGKVVRDTHPYDILKVTEVLKYSSNIGSAKIGKLLERERLHKYLTDFGFGTKLDVDLPGEVSGLLRPPKKWFEIDLAAISFGQGFSITPLQLAVATATIANDGVRMAPYVVEKIVDKNGQVVEEHRPREVKRVVTPEIAKTVREMLVQVTEKGGTGTNAAISGYLVGGKTGTAQKLDPLTRGYSVDKGVGSFAGFVPADDPRLVIVVVLDEPEGRGFGGVVAAPVFATIAEESMRYLKVAPNQSLTAEVPVAQPAEVVELTVPQVPQVTKMPEGDAPAMPNCMGMSYRQVLQTMENTGLNIKINGNGRVVEQSPPPGQAISYGSEVWIRMAPPG